MTLGSPDIQFKIQAWQNELRQYMDDNHVMLKAFYPLRRFETLENVAKVVCEETQVDMDLIRKRTRKRRVVTARHLIAFFARKCTRLSLSEIGVFLGGVDHTTVIHAANHIQDLLDTRNTEVGELVALINERLQVNSTAEV